MDYGVMSHRFGDDVPTDYGVAAAAGYGVMIMDKERYMNNKAIKNKTIKNTFLCFASAVMLVAAGFPVNAESLEDQGMISAPSGDDTSPLVTGIAAAEEGQSDEKLDSLFTEIEEKLPTNNGSWSFYVCDLQNMTEKAYHEEKMQAASLIKLYIMGAVYENYDMILQSHDAASVESTISSMITVSDNDCANTLVTWLGNGDSTVGMTIVNEFCAEHGYTNTSMGRLLLQSNEHGDNYTSVSDCGRFLKEVYESNKTAAEETSAQESTETAETDQKTTDREAAAEKTTEAAEADQETIDREAAAEETTEAAEVDQETIDREAAAEETSEAAEVDQETIDRQAAESESGSSLTAQGPALSHTDSMYKYLKAQTRRNKIPSQLPSGVKCANKTGELDTVENDAGIIYETGSTDLIIVFMSQNLTEVGKAQTTIGSLSLYIYNSYNAAQ